MDDVASCSPTACGCGLEVELIAHLLSEAGDAACLVDIERHVGLSQSTISSHLKTLMDGGIVTRAPRGRWSFYRLRPERLGRLGAILGAMSAETVAT